LASAASPLIGCAAERAGPVSVTRPMLDRDAPAGRWCYMPPDTARISPVIQRDSSEAKRGLLYRLPLKIAANNSRRASALGLDDAGIDRVHPDLPRPEFLG